MTRFPELTASPDYPALEGELLRRWREEGALAKSLAHRADGPRFTFYEGPPTANGKPGIHHVLARTIKDLFCRYQTMRGCYVPRKAGWDTHGLPVEIAVEKQLGFTGKAEIEAFGVAKFNALCRESVFAYKDVWEAMTERMGYWVDFADAYVTCTNPYIESVWWALKQFHEKGLLYLGHKIQPYCPRCGTPLSSHELGQPGVYKEVRDPSVYVKAPLIDRPGVSFLVWTTTPWTLISNTALAVNPDVSYVEVETKGQRLILSEARLSVLGDESAEIVRRMTGAELVGTRYERFFDALPLETGPGLAALTVLPGAFVTTEDGSGIVHMAPAFGEDDYQTGKRYGLPVLQPIDRAGRFTDQVPAFAGQFFKSADPHIVHELERAGKLYRSEPYLHPYPHCWRCETPLIYYAFESWYIATTRYAERMVEVNREINWFPPEVGTGRFGNWLAENKDWAISRTRYWGTPLPFWRCDGCDHVEVVGSLAELHALGGDTVADGIDLHKPFVDEITAPCPKCAGTLRRTPEVLDVWFDSGAMPFAQHGYPATGAAEFAAAFPADFIAEGIDQTRGWFYTLHAIGVGLFDSPAYRNVVSNDLVLDKAGKKMSKRLGNTVDPAAVIEQYGADATRWYMMTASPPWRPTNFDLDGVAEVQRRFLGTLVNTYSFFALYANIDGFDATAPQIALADRPLIDRWALASLAELTAEVTGHLDRYDPMRAGRAIQQFTVDGLSNWYVRLNRTRFWKNDDPTDRLSAYQTLFTCLVTVVKLMAPIAPFISDILYRRLTDDEAGVHLSDFPTVDDTQRDAALIGQMRTAERIVELTRSLRQRASLKVRKPLKRLLVPLSAEVSAGDLEAMRELILREVNVKSLEAVVGDEAVVHRSAKPNFKILGKRFGKQTPQVAERIKALTAAELRELESDGTLSVELDGQPITVERGDLEILSEDIAGWLVASDGGLTVALDTELTPELVREGLAREFVNRVQTMRKEAGFAVTDRIRIQYGSPSAELLEAVQSAAAYICGETLAESLLPQLAPTNGHAAHPADQTPESHRHTWEIEHHPVQITLRRA